MDHARPDVVASIATDWSDEYIECRVDRHDFRPLDASYDPEEQTFTRVRRCRRCHADQGQLWSARSGEVLRRWMDYSGAEGYLLPPGTGVVTASSRNAIRLEMFHRLVSNSGQKRPTSIRKAAKKRSRKRGAA